MYLQILWADLISRISLFVRPGHNTSVSSQATMQTIPWLFFSCIFLYIFQKVLAFWKAIRAVQCAQVHHSDYLGSDLMCHRNHPGHRTLISTRSFLNSFLPKFKGITLGRNYIFDEKHKRQSFCFSASFGCLLQLTSFSFCSRWLGHSYCREFRA